MSFTKAHLRRCLGRLQYFNSSVANMKMFSKAWKQDLSKELVYLDDATIASGFSVMREKFYFPITCSAPVATSFLWHNPLETSSWTRLRSRETKSRAEGQGKDPLGSWPHSLPSKSLHKSKHHLGVGPCHRSENMSAADLREIWNWSDWQVWTICLNCNNLKDIRHEVNCR